MLVLCVPVLYKISTLVDAMPSVSLKSVPVLYKISTLVDNSIHLMDIVVPVLYKISTLVDRIERDVREDGSRSLQNFYSCRSTVLTRLLDSSRSLQNFYSCRWRAARTADYVPVLYKISTLVDQDVDVMFPGRFPFFTKFLLL